MALLVKIEAKTGNVTGIFLGFVATATIGNDTIEVTGNTCVEAARALEAMLRSQEIARRISPA